MTDMIYPTGRAAPVRPTIRKLGLEDIRIALRQGWDDYRAKRGDMIILGLIYPVAGLIAAVAFSNSDALPLLFPMAAGLALLGPALASGFYELARRREAGIDASWWHFLDPLKGRSRFPLATLTIMLAVVFVAWIAAAWIIYSSTLGTEAPATPELFMQAMFSTGPGLTMIVVGNLVGALFAVLTLALAAFSFPMVVDRPVDPLKAVSTSVAAFRAAPGTMIRWGITVALVLLLGALPLFIGLVVALPVLGYATWHLYTRAVAR